MKICEIDTKEAALATIKFSAETISPAHLKQLIGSFSLNAADLLKPYSVDYKDQKEFLNQHGERINAILECIPAADIPSSVARRNYAIVFLAARMHPTLALAIIRIGGGSTHLPFHVAAGIAQSGEKKDVVDQIALQIAAAYPDQAHDVARSHPHLKFEIAEKVPQSIAEIASFFPRDALEMATRHPEHAQAIARMLTRLSTADALVFAKRWPACSEYIAKRFPTLAEEIKTYYTIEY